MFCTNINKYLVLLIVCGVLFVSQCFASVPCDGGGIAGIVIANQNDPVQLFCAKDLQNIFRKVTSQEVDIFEIKNRPAKGRLIYIGCYPPGFASAAKIPKLEDDGIILHIDSDAIVCVGRTASGTYNAVQELLYELNVLSIWPGEFGMCYPAKLDLSKSKLIVHNPSYSLRGGHTIQVFGSPGEKKMSHINIEQWTDWAGRNHVNRIKAGYPRTWDYGAKRAHGWQEVAGHTVQDYLTPASLFAKHPEYFAQIKGKRVAKHPIGTTSQPCLSNPKVQDHYTNMILEHFKKHPNSHRYMIGAADEPSYWCECNNCKALDPVQYLWETNSVGHQTRYNMSDRWLWFVNKIAERVEKQFPDKWLATYSYASTRDIPRDLKNKPRKNVMIEMTIPLLCRKHRLVDSSCSVNTKIVHRLNQWKKISPALSVYSYLEFPYWGIPIPFFRPAKTLYQDLKNFGIDHVSDEIDTTPGASPAYLGLWSRLLWDTNTNVDEYLVKFCNAAYGPASKQMLLFWKYQERVMYKSKKQHRGPFDVERFTPKIIKQSLRILNKAEKENLTYQQLARIQRAKLSIYFAEFYYYKVAKGNAKTLLKRKRASEKVIEIAKKYKFPLNLIELNELGGIKTFAPIPLAIQENSYIFPTEALEGKELVVFPDEWLFKLDPDNTGEREKWFSSQTDLGSFKAISTSSNWEKQWPGSYDGLGWYVIEVTIPEAQGKRVWLLFTGVDETWKLWIDGKYVTSSKGAPMVIWDKPQVAEITGKYSLGKKVRIVVQVHDTAMAGGIYNSVIVTASN